MPDVRIKGITGSSGIIYGLVLVVEAIKLRYAWIDGGIVLPELFFGFAFLVTAFKEIIRFFQVVQGVLLLVEAAIIGSIS